MTPRIAVVDDEPRMARVLAMLLGREGYEVEAFEAPDDFLVSFEQQRFDLVMTDLKMPQMSGIELLEKIRARDADVPVIVMTAHGTIQTAIEAMKLGAFDFVEKPFDNDACKVLVASALERTRLVRENHYLRAELRERYRLDNLIVASDAMRQTFELAHRAARSRATVLVWGESGTGKEVVARSIHYHSDRVGKPFVAVNCKAFAQGVLESELFGHKKGAFTGATQDRRGVFERASGGTIFLDEIGEVDMGFQTKLLRVFQEYEVQPVGSEHAIPVDVRLVVATNKNLQEEVAQGRFREDLYFRLAVIPIHLPPLRERRADILPLARHFLKRWSQELGRNTMSWSDEVEEYIRGYDWPGNVRELENTLERAVVLARTERIELEDLMVDSISGKNRRGGDRLEEVVDEATRRHIRLVLERVEGRRQDAADILGIDRTTLYRLMKKLDLD
jgi:DNA-binding NtrC family response regulator